MNNKKEFNEIIKKIKSIEIQGATNIAKKGIHAYSLIPNEHSKKILLSARPTEPMLENALGKIKTLSKKEILNHFEEAQTKINKNVFKTIHNRDRIFTHCHSTNVTKALIYSKKKGRKFEVYNTETRPLFQGRKTARELKKAGIKVTTFVDSTSFMAIKRENKKDSFYATKIFIGSDALLKEGVINKIGSRAISELSKISKVPVYVIADSWKFTKKRVPLEQRNISEVWNRAPKKIIIKNPAFEFVPKENITRIISEKGVLKYGNFLKKVS